MSNVRKAISMADPEALLLRQERERRMLDRAEERRDVVVFSLGVIALLAVVAAVAGWWLYLAGAGCGVSQ